MENFSKTLYAKSSTGKVLFWKIEARVECEITDGIVITRSHGQLPNGAISYKEDLIEEGKAGRSVEEQAYLRMNAYIKNKMDAGFVSSKEDAMNKERTNGIGFPRQMLARSTKKEPKVLSLLNFILGVFVQRKYNGYRCTIFNLGGVIVAYTRKGIEIKTLSHILDDLDIPEGTGIDGELYRHGWSLQKISSRVKKEYSDTKEIKFMLFDALTVGNFEERLNWGRSITENNPNILIAETVRIEDLQHAYVLRDSYIAERYEGAILRTNTHGYEEGKRSESVWKLKVWDDGEFLIVGVVSSKDGWAIFNCVTVDGKSFDASAPGNIPTRRKILEEKEKYIGKYVNIEFPEFTPSGVPFQPVAKYIREDF